jgi:hypothetical protein
MKNMIAEISGDIHGEVDERKADADESRSLWRLGQRGGAKRDRKRIAAIARAANIPVRGDGNWVNGESYWSGSDGLPNWSSGSYKNLMGAYFALKQMSEGTDVPWMLQMSGSNLLRRQMREITRAILQNHSKALMNQFGASLNITDDEKRDIIKDPTKPEHRATLIQILDGEVPDNQKGQVEKIIGKADKKLFRARRGVGWAGGMAGKGLWAGVYGNDNWSARGLVRGTKNLAVNTTVGTVSNVAGNAAPIAKIALLTALGGPIGLALGGAVFAKEFRRSGGSAAPPPAALAA